MTVEREEIMEYSIRVNEVKNKEGNKDNKSGSIKGFATVVFNDSFKITNIAILENSGYIKILKII